MSSRPLVLLVVATVISVVWSWFSSAPPDEVSAAGFFDGLYQGSMVWLSAWGWLFSGEVAIQDNNGGFGYSVGFTLGLIVYIDAFSEVIGNAAGASFRGYATNEERADVLSLSVLYVVIALLGFLAASTPIPPLNPDPAWYIYVSMVCSILLNLLFFPSLYIVLAK